MTSTPVWSPSSEDVARCQMTEFAAAFGKVIGERCASYSALHAASLVHSEAFWRTLWDYADVIGEIGDPPFIAQADAMPGARYFPNAQLNFAENLLRQNGSGDAVVFRSEEGATRRLSWRDLHCQVAGLQALLKDAQIAAGDRVAAVVANTPETLAAMLATTGLGGIWSSCSPDFGVKGILDRFTQIEPTVLVVSDGYFYNGKTFDIRDKIADVLNALPSVRQVIVLPYIQTANSMAELLEDAVVFEPDVAMLDVSPNVEFVRLPFSHPLYILFSSGTTGAPKCIVHSAGGTLLQHLKEHRLHCDVRPGERPFYFTTCGWMMWNWLVSGLASNATLLLYDGSPFHPGPSVLFDFAEQERMTIFGTGAKYIDALKKAGVRPRDTHDLSALRMMTSTGSPLVPESFDYVYDAIKSDMHLASISGGTDIVACFVLGNPMLPVYRGEIQSPGLGMAVDVADETGTSMKAGKGELICRQPFPSMPIGFWNDPDGSKYHAAYFSRFDNIWCHGDFAEWTEHDGMIIHGRSDATLNPGGVRIGTAEIYRQVEQFPDVMEAIVIGQDWEDDVRVVLFVVLRDGVTLNADLETAIKRQIRTGASPRHVPAKTVAIADIPRTKSGKITELAVRDIVHGREIKNKEALANPEALDLFKDLPELKA